MRLNWRSEHAVIGGSKVVITTYDDLLEWMDGRASLVRTLGAECEERRSDREGAGMGDRGNRAASFAASLAQSALLPSCPC